MVNLTDCRKEKINGWKINKKLNKRKSLGQFNGKGMIVYDCVYASTCNYARKRHIESKNVFEIYAKKLERMLS